MVIPNTNTSVQLVTLKNVADPDGPPHYDLEWHLIIGWETFSINNLCSYAKPVLITNPALRGGKYPNYAIHHLEGESWHIPLEDYHGPFVVGDACRLLPHLVALEQAYQREVDPKP